MMARRGAGSWWGDRGGGGGVGEGGGGWILSAAGGSDYWKSREQGTVAKDTRQAKRFGAKGGRGVQGILSVAPRMPDRSKESIPIPASAAGTSPSGEGHKARLCPWGGDPGHLNNSKHGASIPWTSSRCWISTSIMMISTAFHSASRRLAKHSQWLALQRGCLINLVHSYWIHERDSVLNLSKKVI